MRDKKSSKKNLGYDQGKHITFRKQRILHHTQNKSLYLKEHSWAHLTEVFDYEKRPACPTFFCYSVTSYWSFITTCHRYRLWTLGWGQHTRPFTTDIAHYSLKQEAHHWGSRTALNLGKSLIYKGNLEHRKESLIYKGNLDHTRTVQSCRSSRRKARCDKVRRLIDIHILLQVPVPLSARLNAT